MLAISCASELGSPSVAYARCASDDEDDDDCDGDFVGACFSNYCCCRTFGAESDILVI